jgi:hypothetical protein
MKRTFTFNRPVVVLYVLPMLALLVFLVLGLLREFNFFVFVMALVSVAILVPVFWLSFLRKMVVSDTSVEWITPKKHYTIPIHEISHYGIVKFRSFRFIYVSKSAEPPFTSEESRVVSDENTFVIQFRRSAYYFLEGKIHQVLPNLEPTAYRKEY